MTIDNIDFSIYPSSAKKETLAKGNVNNPSLSIYGNRFIKDQSLAEYLIEFLLIFSSAKEENGEGKMSFHEKDAKAYYAPLRNGLRRLLFYEQAKKNKIVPYDEYAYKRIIEVLKKKIEPDYISDSQKEDFIEAVQNLMRGYAAVLKTRRWCAQNLLPLCPEMIFCEAMPNDRVRMKPVIPKDFAKKVDAKYNPENTYYDTQFDCTRHNFLGRGGELYYLHLMQAMENDSDAKFDLNKKLNHMLSDKSEYFTQLCEWIQKSWLTDQGIDPKFELKKFTIGFIPKDAYIHAGKYAVMELRNFLSCNLHPVKRVELLSLGVMLQVLRMLSERAVAYIDSPNVPWIIDMKASQSDSTVKRLSVKSLSTVSEKFREATHACLQCRISEARYGGEVGPTYYKDLKDGLTDSYEIFKSKGKELKFIIPSNGPNERFSLSEDLVRFLVLAIVKPGEKMNLDMFLKELYEHFGMVIGPAEYQQSDNSVTFFKELTDSFVANRNAFQDFLKSCGFLRDLSDATSIVVNPYEPYKTEGN